MTIQPLDRGRMIRAMLFEILKQGDYPPMDISMLSDTDRTAAAVMGCAEIITDVIAAVALFEEAPALEGLDALVNDLKRVITRKVREHG